METENIPRVGSLCPWHWIGDEPVIPGEDGTGLYLHWLLPKMENCKSPGPGPSCDVCFSPS